MKFRDMLKIWDILNIKNTGDLGPCDLDDAINKVVGVEYEVPNIPTEKESR